MEIFYQILTYVNFFFICLASIGFLFQLMFIFFAWLKPRKYKKATKQARFAIAIPAHDEADVIERTIRQIVDKQTYPRDKYDIFVCAHNCSDDTAKIAKANGATVFIFNDADPKHRMRSYAVKNLTDNIMSLEEKYDAIIYFDADNILKEDYIEKVNDAFECGVQIARGYEYSSNLKQNNWTKVSGTYYIRDSRIASNFRERAGLDSMLCGPGMLVATQVFKEIGTWDAMSASEDVDFTLNRMCEKRRIHYIPDAVIYEDQPSTFKDTFNRLTRMGHGLNSLFWKKGFKFLGKFFTTGRFSYIDLFMQLAFIPISLICCVWFPTYYIFYCIVHLINALGPAVFTPEFFSAASSASELINLAYMVLYVLVCYYLIYTFQTGLAVWLDKKKLGLTSLKGVRSGIFLSAGFMIIYAIGISVGICSKQQRKKINRNTKIDEGLIK
ncbi:MAG: glycosyltransferase family 2 protein [Bacilli bacterium]